MATYSTWLTSRGTEGRISRGALRVTVGTAPRALAFSAAGSVLNGVSIGRALWILVDGDPLDKILKVDPDTGALDTAFGTNGAVDAPSSKIDGMTLLSGFLWLASNESSDRKLYKLKGTDGSLSQAFNVGGFPNGFIFDDIGGLSNDGTNLMAFLKPFNDLVVIHPWREGRDAVWMLWSVPGWHRRCIPYRCESSHGSQGLSDRSV